MQDLLREVTTDLRRDWIQEHTLRPDPVVVASVMCTESQLVKLVPLSFRPRVYQTSPISSDGFFVSVRTCFGITVGVGVKSSNIPGDPPGRQFRFAQYVRTVRTGAVCILSFDHSTGIFTPQLLYPAITGQLKIH